MILSVECYGKAHKNYTTEMLEIQDFLLYIYI